MIYITFEKVKEMLKNSIDETANINEALEKTVQLIYLRGYKDGSRRLWLPSTIPPKVSDKYLVVSRGTHFIGIDYYTTLEDAKRLFDEEYENDMGWRSQNVLAWMPLPEPYKVESEVRNDKEIMLEEKEHGIEIDIKLSDGTLIGTAIISTAKIEPNKKILERFVIFEPYQNKGYGQKALSDLIDSYGVKKVWVFSDNKRAIHIYEKAGFNRVKETMFILEMERK